MNQALVELIDKVNATGKAVLVVEVAPALLGENEVQQAARYDVYLIRGQYSPPSATSPSLSITGSPLMHNLLGVLERTRLGSASAQNEFEQALAVLPIRRRQYSPDHRWILYDGHPAQPQY